MTSNCLAFDYGTVRIGTAVGDLLLGTSRPLGTVRNINGTPDWQSVDKLVDDWQPSRLIVGWPLNEAGEEQPLCDHIRGFAKKLKQRYNLDIALTDERFSSNAAQQLIRDMRRSGQRNRKSRHSDVDSVAAALILESWLDTQANS